MALMGRMIASLGGELGRVLLDVFLPFILIFTIVFAALEKSSLLGKDKKNFNVVIALVVSLTTVIPHVTRTYPPGYDVIEIMNRALPQISVVLVGIIMLLVIIGVWGGKVSWAGGSVAGWVALLAVFIVLLIFGRAAGWFQTIPSWLWWLDDPELGSFLIIVLVFALIIWFVTKSDVKTERATSLTKEIGDFFRGK